MIFLQNMLNNIPFKFINIFKDSLKIWFFLIYTIKILFKNKFSKYKVCKFINFIVL